MRLYEAGVRKFLSTPSARRATLDRWSMTDTCLFLSTPSARRATYRKSQSVSIPCYFYPRPPRGGRHCGFSRRVWPAVFLSTPSARRATILGFNHNASREDFYPRPPRGGRPRKWAGNPDRENFYPRPPRGGRHTYSKAQVIRSVYFYPRPPRGGRPQLVDALDRSSQISIHALREEGDGDKKELRLDAYRFLSTPSARRATYSTGSSLLNTIGFLSTPSARRATPCCYIPRTAWSDFYPRPPRGGRLSSSSMCRYSVNFYPRPPRGGRLCFARFQMSP